MFSPNSTTTYDPFSFMNGGTDQSPNLTPENQNSSPFSHRPISFLDTDADGMLIMNHIFPHHPEQQVTNNPDIKETKKSIKVATRRKRSANGTSKVAAPRKRTAKKDRHSKIYTSQGPRDRRMRLSLPIARKFFDLQDMLGFDKASKTIEWLFTKSKADIQEVTDNFPRIMWSCSGGNGKTVSSTSESEVLSVDKEKLEENRERKVMNCPSFPKESREKARARARERTKDKMKMKMDDSVENFQYSSSSTQTESGGRNSGAVVKIASILEDQCHHHKFSISNHDEMDSVNIIEKFQGISSSGPRFEGHDHVFTDNMEIQYGFSAMGSEKELSGNGIHVQNPNSIFMASSNIQEQNPNSVFMNHPSIQGSTSIFDSHFQENEFKYCGFY